MKISLTEFIDFIGATGTTRLTKVRKAKCRGIYSPQFDHWKQLREAIALYHESAAPSDKTKFFNTFLSSVIDERRRKTFPPVIENYKKFLGRKIITGLPVQKAKWTHGDLTISINPELFLNIGGSRELIKLYFKPDALTKKRSDLILTLMAAAIPDNLNIDAVAVYDTKSNKIQKSASPNPDLMILVRAEAEAYASIWNQIECPQPVVVADDDDDLDF